MTLLTAAINEIRNSNYALNPVSLVDERSILLEGSKTNLALQSEDFSTANWSKTNITVTANDQIAPDNTLTADKLSATANGGCLIHQAGMAATSTAVTCSVYVKGGTGGTIGGSFTLRNDTTATNLISGLLNYDTGVITGAGARVESLDNGWYRVILTATTGIAVGNVIRFYPGAGGIVLNADEYWYAWGAQVEDGAFVSSYIPTTTASVTRSADNYSVPFNLPPQEMTVYCKFIEGIGGAAGNAILFIGAAAGTTDPRFGIYRSSGTAGYRAFYDNGVAVESTGLLDPPVGSQVELRAVLNSNGSCQIHQSINGAAETSGVVTASAVLATAWSDSKFWLNSNGATINIAFHAYLTAKIARGTLTMAQMRALPNA